MADPSIGYVYRRTSGVEAVIKDKTGENEMHYKDKKIVKIIPVVLLGTSLLWLVISFAVSNIPEKVNYVYTNGKVIKYSWHDVYDIISEVIGFILLALFAVATMQCVKLKLKTKEKLLKIFVFNFSAWLVSTLIIASGNIVVTGVWNEEDYHPQYYEFTNNGKTIVIEEKSFLLKGNGTIYQIENNNAASIIGEFSTDDGGRNYGNYDIQWNDSYVEITYHTFHRKDTSETIWVELK